MSLGSPVRVGLAGLASALLAVAVSTPAEAKEFRTNLRADPAMVDPVTYSELVAGDVMKNLYEGFTERDKDGNVTPALAVRWEAHPDNKGFRFHLRKGVKFHSGREFTAKDVKGTFEQILLPGNKGGLTLTYLKVLEGAPEIQEGKATQLSGTKVIDPYTLDVRFTKADVLFPIYPFQFMDSGIVAQHGTDWPTKVSAGTGPFKFVHSKRGQEVRLAAHKEYWGGAPLVDEVAMLIVPTYDTAVSMYEANALDVIELEAILATLGRAVRPRLRQKLGGHADELETSLVLAIEPDAVRMDRAEPDYGHTADAPATVFYQPVVFDADPGSRPDWSRTGARGDPSLATRETGEAALQEIARELVEGLVALYPDLR